MFQHPCLKNDRNLIFNIDEVEDIFYFDLKWSIVQIFSDY